MSLNWFRRRNPGRELAERSAAKRRREALTEHERIIAKAREMCVQMGKPVPTVLREGGR